jgi:hypothetical protein
MRGQGLPPLSPAPLSSLGAHFLRCATDMFFLDEAEHFLAQSICQRRYAPRVFGFIPECRSGSFGIGVRLRRNPQSFAGDLSNLKIASSHIANNSLAFVGVPESNAAKDFPMSLIFSASLEPMRPSE